ncbi:MAG: DNA polymerase III subunit beta [Endomicrobiales bacterium]|nr:DNA polymerase III subunit beta [Endomicrobiales bacterium]
MKVICEKEELLKGTQTVQTVVSPRSTLPILSNFLFETEDKKIKLSSTDLEVGVSCHIKGEVIKEGSITIPAKRFADIVRELADGSDIEIRADETNQISMKSGKSHFILMGLPKSEYPVLPDFPEDKTFKINKNVLKSMLKKVSFAVSTDETRYVLNGVYFMAGDGALKMVATDGRRLAFVSSEGIDKKIQQKVIVPTKAVNEIQRILSAEERDSEIKIGIGENQIAFQIDSITILSRLIEGTFPNYEQVIPKKHDIQIKVNVKETLSAVKQMSLLTTDKAAAVKFLFTRNVLRVSATTSGLGSGESETDIDYTGGNLEIAFNPSFLIDVFKNAEEDFVNFELTNSLNPALVSPSKNRNYLCVVMPMRL